MEINKLSNNPIYKSLVTKIPVEYLHDIFLALNQGDATNIITNVNLTALNLKMSIVAINQVSLRKVNGGRKYAAIGLHGPNICTLDKKQRRGIMDRSDEEVQ